ncbi:hypothetical protein HPB51_011169 [Rhipicephalus microplus]|uniref:Uncharacterized protein n=1 Tax=Rhipicephalus microplus TaxID=6941 RepID=A0A9J6E0D8_RHIMP|nr:hypothetical protein HPB51_011169 [Rhipicephalus microplus]
MAVFSSSSAASLRRSRSDGGGDTSSDEEECDAAASGATLADGVSSRATANGVGRRNDVEDDDDDEDDEEVRDLTWSGRVNGGVGVMNGLHGSAAASSARSSSQRSSSSTAVVPPTPVEFRASPPLHVHRPYNGSPPPKVFHAAPGAVGGSSPSATSSSSGPTTLTLSAHIPAFEVCAVSPRKRHRQDGGGTAFGVFSLVDGGPVQRPCLDFEKMQQVAARWPLSPEGRLEQMDRTLVASPCVINSAVKRAVPESGGESLGKVAYKGRWSSGCGCRPEGRGIQFPQLRFRWRRNGRGPPA